jgi:hypothetical protein
MCAVFYGLIPQPVIAGSNAVDQRKYLVHITRRAEKGRQRVVTAGHINEQSVVAKKNTRPRATSHSTQTKAGQREKFPLHPHNIAAFNA